MMKKRTFSVLAAVTLLLPLTFLRCERNDLFEISNAKFSLSSELKVQYLGAVDYIDVPYTGVEFGTIAVMSNTSMNFQLVNITDNPVCDINLIDIVIEPGTYFFRSTMTLPTTIAMNGGVCPFLINFSSSMPTADTYTATVRIQYSTFLEPGNTKEIVFTVKVTTILA
jgi:hypothetical protein